MKKLLYIIPLFLIFLSWSFLSKDVDIEKEKEEVLKTVLAHNKSWTVLEDLNEQAKYIQENIIMITPGDRDPIIGREAYLKGYKKWNNAAKVHFFKELNPIVKLSENMRSAVVFYNIDMAYNYNGEEKTFQGRDFFFLTKESGKWLIMANEYSRYPEKDGDE